MTFYEFVKSLRCQFGTSKSGIFKEKIVFTLNNERIEKWKSTRKKF